MTRPEAAFMTAEERKKLPPNERRAFHQGPHDGTLIDQISTKMNYIVESGKAKNWSQSQYDNKLRDLISEYRQPLKQGKIALNSHHRSWAERLRPTGGK